MSREQSSFALLLLAGVTASVLATTIWWRKKRKDAPPKKWRRVGELSEIALFPLKSGKGIELREAQCTTAGLITTENVDPTLKHLGDRILVIYDGVTKEYVTCRRLTQTLHISVTSGGMGTVLLNAPGMPQFKLILPVKGDVINCLFWKRENVPMLDCGDEVADWLNKYLHQDKMRLGYKPPPILKQHRKTTAEPWKPFTKVFTELKDDYMGIFTDLASYMIMTEESLEEMNSRMSEKLPAKQFRPNFMIKGTVAHEEDSWKWVKIGEHVILRIFMPCTRCMVTTVNPETAVRHPQMEPVKTLKTYRQVTDPLAQKLVGTSPLMGVYLGLYSGEGHVVRIGDPVYVDDE